jgi:hypothetical protein
MGKNNYTGVNSTGWNNFTVTAAQLTNSAPQGLPYEDNLNANDGRWSGTGGWNHTGTSWRYGNGSSYAGAGDGSSAGSLTSSPIQIPASGMYYLRFNYRYHTESSSAVWDQRRLQISVDGGPFEDLPEYPQLSGEAFDAWIDSPVINLLAYRGKTVRLRFYFTTLDGLKNQGLGWEIDSLSFTNEPPPNTVYLPIMKK